MLLWIIIVLYYHYYNTIVDKSQWWGKLCHPHAKLIILDYYKDDKLISEFRMILRRSNNIMLHVIAQKSMKNTLISLPKPVCYKKDRIVDKIWIFLSILKVLHYFYLISWMRQEKTLREKVFFFVGHKQQDCKSTIT